MNAIRILPRRLFLNPWFAAMPLVLFVSCGGGGLSSSSASYSLTINKTGPGTITSNPAGINCGTTCTGSFANGTTVTLTATPDANSSFTGWGGDCTGTGTSTCKVVISGNKVAAATFVASVAAAKLAMIFKDCTRVTGDKVGNVYCDVTFTNTSAKTAWIDINDGSGGTVLRDTSGKEYSLRGTKYGNAPFTNSGITLSDLKPGESADLKLRINLPLNISKIASGTISTTYRGDGYEYPKFEVKALDIQPGDAPALIDLGGRVFLSHQGTINISFQSCYRVSDDLTGNIYCDVKFLNLVANDQYFYLDDSPTLIDLSGKTYLCNGAKFNVSAFAGCGYSYGIENIASNSPQLVTLRFSVPLTIGTLKAFIFPTRNGNNQSLQIDGIPITP
jgi:Divergent InlB B-repeat domain